MPLMKNSHTLQPGAQKPQPGPLPTGPWKKRGTVTGGHLRTLQDPSPLGQFTWGHHLIGEVKLTVLNL